MIHRFLPRLSLRLFVFALLMAPTIRGEAADGLLATYSDGTRVVQRVVPTPNFMLAADQSVHSQIGPQFTASFAGNLVIKRGGDYALSGNAEIVVNGTPVSGRKLKLSVGKHALKISFTRKSGPARFQLRWSSEFFIDEPVPPTAFEHDASKVSPAWTRIEAGRDAYEKLSCGSCHGSGGWKLTTRQGPDLSSIGARATGDWLFTWLKNPRHYRPTSVMPSLLKSEKDARDAAQYLTTLVAKSPPLSASAADPLRIEAGKALFEKVGCTKCHGEKGHSLEGVGAKFKSSAALAAFVGNPLHTDPSGMMPQLFDPSTQANELTLVGDYLFHSKRNTKGWSKLAEGGNVQRGRQLVASSGCTACHHISEGGKSLDSTYQSPLFTTRASRRLLHYWSFDGDAKDGAGSNHGRVRGKSQFQAGPDRLQGAGQAFAFDGSTFLELSHFKRPDKMSITAWIKTPRGGSLLAWAKQGRGSREFRIGEDGRDALTYGEYNSDGGWRPVIQRSKTLVDDKWHHVAVVRDGTRAQLFLDGKPFGRAGRVQTSAGSYTDNLLIGALKLGGSPNKRFRGLIDDLAIWSEPLSAEDIATLANGKLAKALASGPKQNLADYEAHGGCLSATVSAKLPDYQLNTEERAGLQAFMRSVRDQPVIAEAPVETFYRHIARFNCTACHSLNKELPRMVELTDGGKLRAVERPPALTGAGDKLQVSWIRQVLLNKKRTRPWMKTVMPHFGPALGDLPELFPAATGSPLNDDAPRPDQKLAADGMKMIGVRRGKASCIACHNYRGINRQREGVVPAPDMADIGQTLRRDWFRRWLRNPPRMAPGTSMPQFFLELNDDQKDEKIEQLWSALVHQSRLALPKGLIDNVTQGTRVVVGDTPVLLRVATKIPNAQIDRAINVGLPGGRHFTFDARSSQLRYVWQGDFIDAGPAWNGRGGNPVNAGGKPLLVEPDHFPLRIGDTEGTPKSRFLGYSLLKGYPVFRYVVDGVEIQERIEITETHVVRIFNVGKTDKTLSFVGVKGRKYSSPTADFQAERLRLPGGTSKFIVRTAFQWQ